MSKPVFTIVLPDPKVRKKQAPPAKAHTNRHAYTRKRKHKDAPDADGWSRRGKALESSGAFLIRTLAARMSRRTEEIPFCPFSGYGGCRKSS